MHEHIHVLGMHVELRLCCKINYTLEKVYIFFFSPSF